MLQVDKGKHKVHYADKPVLSPIPDPAPVAEVLQRSGDDVQDTSAGAMSTDAAGVNTRTVDWGQVVLRDRMLVRVSYSKSEDLGPHFDEYQNRMTTGLQYADWAEFMVVWRRDKIELYEDYSTPGKERLTGHKHLAFVVPLKSGRTRLSMYSFIDMTFCITCPPTPTTAPSRTASKSRGLFHISKQGTNIFVFKVKTRSRALDWIWQLWRHIGGQLPKIIQVRNPTLDTIVKIDVPNITTVENDKMFTRSNIIRLCIESLHNVSDWKEIVERQINGGKVLELAWRIDTNLDWIWLETDMYGFERPWTVLCGLALGQAHLEIRLGDHYPNKVPSPKKADEESPFITEPPSIEGYVERIKPHTQTKQRVYMVTHEGNLFLVPPPKAHPPSPFLSDEDEGTRTPLRDREVARGVSQIMDAFGVADLRCILAVRRANAPSLNKHADKQHLRMKRSFELLLTSGHVVRFEVGFILNRCHSCKHALEWIERLRALVAYWTLRHKCDAREEMEVSSARRPRLTPRHHIHVLDEDLPPFPPPDPAAPLPALSTMYNWCVLEGCKPIIRGGKVHMRRGLYGQYKMAQMFLIAGHLVMFRIKPTTALHLTMKKRISLVDAYVCSGYFAALALPGGQYDPEVNSAPRHYQDGLETDDPEEDMLFMVWYHKKAKASAEVPALSAKRKLVVFRTRSKLERDSWCWALNTEIERISRGQRAREAVLRMPGR
ncbi:hypothetical protein BDZ89DRAFT_965606 [Hymenopellis radicata]|nr:hypothetical protein BDZ89DRAFT_965606 [Hymenopellis radicata]